MASPAMLGAPKVAIPRLQRRESPDPSDSRMDESSRNPRVNRACLMCRKRKVKCSGDTPRCTNCIGNNLECVYERARRDRLKSATEKNKDLVQLLRELSLRASDSDRALIQDALEGYEDESGSVVSVKSQKRRKIEALDEADTDEDDPHPHTATRVSAAMRAEGTLAHVDEDLLRSSKSRATGWVGQGAGVHWLRSLVHQLSTEKAEHKGGPDNNSSGGSLAHPPMGASIPVSSVSDATFYLDSDGAELDVDVDPYEMPPLKTAENLLKCYMRTVHRSFPILPPQFEDQFRRYFKAKESQHPLQVPDKWLAIVNIVFAIGARYSHLTCAEWQGDERDHLVYMTRTVRLLGSWPFGAAPDLALIQVSGLLSFYYQIIGHVSRGWVMIGIAIRLALALGLHLRNEDPKIPPSRKETLLRTWWSLHAIECLFSSITGRPCVLGHEDCTVALPMALTDEITGTGSPSDSSLSTHKPDNSPIPASNSNTEKARRLHEPRSYLDAHLNIGLITQKLLFRLYAPRTANRSWSYVQKTIPVLLEELNDWKRGALPEEDALRVRASPHGSREVLLLRFYYFSTKILITRPCLCRFGRKLEDQSHSSVKFDQQMAEACVDAALGLTQLLADDPDPNVLYENGPWWSLIHNIMQVMAVLLLELSYGEKHMRGDQIMIKDSVKKLLRWLHAMRTSDAVVERAYQVIVNILQQQQFCVLVGELLKEDEAPDMDTQQPTSNPTHAHPEQDPPSKTNFPPEIPQPNEWYNAHYPEQNHMGSSGFNPAATDPQLMAGLGQETIQQHEQTMDQGAQTSQPHSQAEEFQFLDDPFNNPYMFANPFMTNYDQDAPFGLGNLWSQDEGSGQGSGDQQNLPDFQNYYAMHQDHNQGQQDDGSHQ